MSTTSAPTHGQAQAVPHEPARGRPTSHFRPDIEGLRAVAVGLVLLDHVLGWPAGGFIGVDVFFVISGFLITGLLVRERQRAGRISFRAFYVRRARRLMPAAVATLGTTTLAAWVLFPQGRFWETVDDGVWALFFGANIRFAQQGTDYFEQTAAPSPFQHFWSLAVEEQFYVLWPALILAAFAVRLGSRGHLLGPVMVAVTAASLCWSVYATAAYPATAYFSTFTRAWELGVGALVAVASAQLSRVPGRLQAVLAWAGLTGVLLSASLITARTPFPGSAALLPVLSTALLMAFGGATGGPRVTWALGSSLTRFLGRISYSLYLWHWPVVVVLAATIGGDKTVFHLSAIVVSLGVAAVSYYAIEQPVLHSNWLLPRSDRFERRQSSYRVRRRAREAVFIAACVTTVVSVALTVFFPPGRLNPQAVAAANAALVAGLSGGDPDTDSVAADPLVQEIETATYALTWPSDLEPSIDELSGYLQRQWSGGCFDVTASNVDRCLYGDPAAPRRAMVLGDSIAGAWLPGLIAGLEPQGWSVQTLTMGQCPNITAPTLYNDRLFTECAEHRDWALEHISEVGPDLVILSNAYHAELADPDAERADVWRDGLTEIVEQIQLSGARVVVLGNPPGSANLQSCATGVSEPADCARKPGGAFAEQVGIEGQVAVATGARAIDPERWFCALGTCPAIVGGTPVYADGLHMTREYAEKIGPSVAAVVLATAELGE